MSLQVHTDGRWSRLTSSWRAAAVVGLVISLVIVAAVLVFSATTFRESFLANFLATMAGVTLGVPIAVWLALRQSSEQRMTVEREAEERRNQVLQAVRGELVENKNTLVARRSEGGTRGFFVPFLMDEVWAAVSDGGQLQWVTDVEVLRRLARAYVFIRTVIYLERQAFEIMHYPGAQLGVRTDQGQMSAAQQQVKKIEGYLDHQDSTCIAAIDEALAVLDPLLAHP